MASCYLTDQDFKTILQAIDDGSDHKHAAFDQLCDDADAMLEEDVLSVRSATNSPYLYVDANYVPGKDGVTNPDTNRKASGLLSKVSKTSFTLACTWRLSHKHQYADKALDFIHAWCINEDTRMFATGQVEGPALPHNRHGGNVGMMMTLPLFFTACYLLDDYPGWGLTAHARVRRWIKDMVDPQRQIMFFNGYEMYNNWEDARLRYLATGALALDDLELLQYCFDRWRTIIPIKMDDDGSLPRECERTRSMPYTIASLGMALDTAEIAKSFGVDLYNYSHNGKSIKLAVDYAADHLLQDMKQWPHQMLHPYEEEAGSIGHVGMWELAYRAWKDPRYLEVMKRYHPRPIHRDRASLLFGVV